MFFGVFQAVIAAWALAVPILLARLRVLTPDLSALTGQVRLRPLLNDEELGF
jgi:hypothetical protein